MDLQKPIHQLYIGIDTGRHTGIAIWDKSMKCFLKLEECLLILAFGHVLRYHNSKQHNIVKVRVEDARLRSRSKSDPNYYATMKGAGSVCRDATFWEETLTFYGIPFEMVAPQSNMTKVDVEKFRQMTGLYQPSSHVRDAAMLVLNF